MPVSRKRKGHNVKLAKRKANIISTANRLKHLQEELVEKYREEYRKKKEEAQTGAEEIKN